MGFPSRSISYLVLEKTLSNARIILPGLFCAIVSAIFGPESEIPPAEQASNTIVASSAKVLEKQSSARMVLGVKRLSLNRFFIQVKENLALQGRVI